MGAGVNFDGDAGVIGVGVPLARESLDVAVAVLVDIIDDPSFLDFASGIFPTALAD